MSLPRYLDAFRLDEIPASEFSVALREPVGAQPEYDVRDERGDAIGYLRIAGDSVHLSAPYLEATGLLEPDGHLELRDEQHVVITIGREAHGCAVSVPDRRVAVRLAAGVVVALDQHRNGAAAPTD